jgi:hypothetical protein
VLGENHIQVALTLHCIAIAHSLSGAFRDALASEQASKVFLF